MTANCAPPNNGRATPVASGTPNSSRPSLGSQQCLYWVCESASLSGAFPRVHWPRVANQHHIPTRILPLRSLRSWLPQQRLARWGFKPNLHQSVSDLPGLTQARGDSNSFEMMKKQSGDKRVPSMDHGDAIHPTGPMSRTTDTRCLPETKPTKCKRQSGGRTAPEHSDKSVLRMFARHCHTARS